LRLPHRRFHRHQGIYANLHFDMSGNPIDEATWNRRQSEWLPSAADKAYVESLMHPVHERGRIAGWIAPPSKGINGQPFEFEYVRRA
jgi:benzoyl-CoA 2,3-dioxygenase component B